MGSSQQFSLRWNNYLHHITSAFDSLRSDLDLVDVTLSCEGKKIKAHKMLLSACSSYFKDLFKENPCQHPVIVFRNVNFSDLEALIDFMYQGEVNVVQEQLASFLTTAELLAVQGLTDGNAKDLTENLEEENSEPTEETVTEIDAHTLKRTNSSTNNTTFNTPNLSPASPQAKRKKWSAPATASAASATSHKSRNSSNETKQLSRTSLSSGVNSVDIIPVLPQVKVEMPDFLEADSDQISFNNSEPVENPLEDISSLEHNLSAAVGSSKEESLDVYGGNSSDTGEITGEQMTPAELSQVLAKAGPSSEGSQDSLQGPSWRLGPYGLPSGAPPGAYPASANLLLNPMRGVASAVRPRLYPDGRRRYPCQFCDKTFAHRISVALHMSIHQGKTECHICRKVFSRAYNLKLHIQTVHAERHAERDRPPPPP
ncbi:broad-complex core protein isoforms 1/2/3/4/5 isoform X3 [Frankliniella occidentalis]|uniref:Broad-complex core protein isoforms 1/2/3/4/5 isoform X3 n=1 Tax=Frankliniella occidentalis TaxID=133901 RepID=A0A6J1T2S6_FRAOC|nr:broad-complex core protein isoforms 1/2/3/4/5 isoform X3 [Frankliniella occidentalis]